jgi:hypothetical protein
VDGYGGESPELSEEGFFVTLSLSISYTRMKIPSSERTKSEKRTTYTRVS